MKEYIFIDLHIHTEFSNEDGCDLKVEKLLDTLQAMAEHKNGDICFSITDHESILGAIKANKILKANPEKYNRLTFIPGIELNASLKNVALNKNGQSIFSKCHMLGYDYNINDKNLIAYSMIAHKVFKNRFGKNVNSGKQLLYAKKIIERNYNVKIPFKVYIDCGYAYTHNYMRKKFIYLTSKYLKVDEKEIENLIEKSFLQKLSYNPEADGGSKQDIFEIISLIKSAGGKTSIAHANSIKFQQHIIVHNKSKQDYLDDFVRIVQQKSNHGLDALELFHSENTADEAFDKLYEIANKYDMFLTCGSDHHGEHLHVNSLLSKCFSKRFEFCSVKKENKEKYRAVVKNVITKLAFVDNICAKNKTFKTKRDFVCKNVEKGNLGYKELSRIIQFTKNINKEDFKNFYNIPTTVINKTFVPNETLTQASSNRYTPLNVDMGGFINQNNGVYTVIDKKYSNKKDIQTSLKNNNTNKLDVEKQNFNGNNLEKEM